MRGFSRSLVVATARLLRFQQRVQPFETLVPVPLELGSPYRHFPQGLGLQPAPASLCFASALDETGPLQNLEVFGDRRLADR